MTYQPIIYLLLGGQASLYIYKRRAESLTMRLIGYIEGNAGGTAPIGLRLVALGGCGIWGEF